MERIKKIVRPLFSAVLEMLDRVTFGYMQFAGLIKFAAHTAVEFWSDGSGTTYAISATIPATYTQAGYEASTQIYTAIGKPKTFPAYGRVHPLQEWNPISGAVEKGKGTANFGGGDAVFGDVAADAGQVILKAAAASANAYSMKITRPDGAVDYLDVKVMSWVNSSAASGAPEEKTANIQVQRDPIIVAAV